MTNNGPDAASDVRLDESTPASTTFVSIAAPPGWTCSTPAVGGTGAIACTASTLAASATASFTIVARVDWCAGDGGMITSNASVSSAVTDPDAANNSASTTTAILDDGACDDGNACTSADACQGGACVGGAPVVCTALDPCHEAGACDPATGTCTSPAKADGTTCSDGDACTTGDACASGVCMGLPAGAPSEVGYQRFASKTLDQWDAVGHPGPAPTYDVVRGVVGEWPVGSGASEQCRASGLAATELDDPETPEPDLAFWYLVRGRNECGVGSYGTSSDGSPRSTLACP